MPAHRDLTGSDLHEPKGAANAPAGTVYTANGAGSGSWQPIVIPDPPIPNVILESNTQLPVSPKGTMVVSDGTNWPTVGLGSVGQVLTVSASTTTGVEWQPLPTPPAFPSNIGPVINQVAHGFTTGTPVYFDGTVWQEALADASGTVATHIVETSDVDNFKAVMFGVLEGLSGMTPGDWQYVSESTPGTLTNIAPLTGYINKVGQALTDTVLMVFPATSEAA